MAVHEFVASAPDGRRLQGIAAGAEGGTLVVRHHGTPGIASEFWGPHVDEAEARDLRLASYSRPGCGGSDRDRGRSVASCAADAAAVADALGAERFLTMGESGGGPHALACGALLPDRVMAAASVAGVAPFDGEGLDWLDGMGEENVAEFAAVQAGPDELEGFLRRSASELETITGDQVLEALGDLISPADAAVLTSEYAEFVATSIRDAMRDGIWGWFDDDLAFAADWGFDLGRIGVPVGIWQGRDDRFVPPAHGEWLAAHVAGARVHLLDGQGHLSLELARFGDILDELVRLADGRGT